jgi:hypothetical protein
MHCTCENVLGPSFTTETMYLDCKNSGRVELRSRNAGSGTSPLRRGNRRVNAALVRISTAAVTALAPSH